MSSSGRIVIFGAGSIGRSFIAPVFMDGGYETVFVDVVPGILKALEERGAYDVVYKDDSGESRRRVAPVRGVNGGDAQAVRRELEGAGCCVTCVGAGALPAVLKSIAAALPGRDADRPLDIILAENLKGAADTARGIFAEAAGPSGSPGSRRQARIGIVETSIGKMVPIMPAGAARGNPLLCWAEPFNTLIVDARGFVGPIPRAPDIKAVAPIAPWVARKLYIHNFGHAALAYLGRRELPDARYVWEVMENGGVSAAVERGMRTVGAALCLEFPDVFTLDDIQEHVSDLIRRFANRALGDSLYRTGRDLKRKLHRNDRVVGALELVRKHALDVRVPLDVFRAALCFDAPAPVRRGKPDEADSAVRALSSEPESFLRHIVGIPDTGLPELTRLLRDVLEERRNSKHSIP